MANADDALEALREIKAAFASFCQIHGKVTEADTRAQVIDRIIDEVLYWPRACVDRERYVRTAEKGRSFLDYGLTLHGKTSLILEAKREGITFTLPHGLEFRAPALSGSLLSDTAIQDAIVQVQGYCVEEGVRFAIATNGYAWIVFRALRDDIPWKKGHARIFPSLESIEQRFTEFWNLLSYGAIDSGSLTTEFGRPLQSSRELKRVTSRLFNVDLPMERNRLHGQLGPVIKTFFADIGDLDQVKVLQNCYVHNKSLEITAHDLQLVIRDTVPELLKNQGAKEIRQTRSSAGEWDKSVASALGTDKGELFLLLGGIGAGKTTFLRRYQRTIGATLLADNTYWFHVSFIGPPLDSTRIEGHICETILEQLRSRYHGRGLEERKMLKRAFKPDIEALNETLFGGLSMDSNEYERTLSPHLATWQSNTNAYVPRILRIIRDAKRRTVVLFVDNVDQLSPAYQQQIFLVAQALTNKIGSLTVIALREESYFTANAQKTFAAYATRKFHIASPRFRTLIGTRINLTLDVLTKQGQGGGISIPTAIDLDTKAIVEFLRIVQYSIFQHNKNIARMIEALCFGNMRQALDWFSTFLTSGATDVDKMLTIYRRDGAYYVPYHEFVKSIMLSERKFYMEANSPILNVFDCSGDRNSGHFTALRVLSVLLQYRAQNNPESRGYYEISKLVAGFEDVFDNRDDLIRTFNKLVAKQLIEANTHSTESIANATHLRATSAGWYYTRYLVKSFSYLDLVLQDTPLSDAGVEAQLRDSVSRVDNLGDKQQDKLERLEARFARVDHFLEYLSREETHEREAFSLKAIRGPLGKEWIPEIKEDFGRQKAWILRRVKENREKYVDDEPTLGESTALADEEFRKLDDDDSDPAEPEPGIAGGSERI